MQYLLFIALFAVTAFSADVEPVRVRIPITAALANSSNWQNKIVGGTVVPSATDYPFMAAYLDGDFQFCGASIIAPNWALTAAHCIASATPTRESIAIGSLRYDGAGNPSAVYHTVERTYRHPSFSSSNLDYDAALLLLSTPIQFNQYSQPVTLATGSATYTGISATVIGWGTTSSGGSASSVLREVDVPVISNAECSTMYDGVTARMLCAYEPGKDSCQGDSGGPIFDTRGGETTQIGIVSWGIGCAGVGAPGVYTRVSTIASWVCSTANVC